MSRARIYCQIKSLGGGSKKEEKFPPLIGKNGERRANCFSCRILGEMGKNAKIVSLAEFMDVKSKKAINQEIFGFFLEKYWKIFVCMSKKVDQ